MSDVGLDARRDCYHCLDTAIMNVILDESHASYVSEWQEYIESAVWCAMDSAD